MKSRVMVTAAEPSPEQRRPSAATSRALLFFAAGVFSLAAQTLLFRHYLLFYRGHELAVGTFFGSWLAWIGVGALLGRRALRVRLRGSGLLALLLWVYALAPLLQLALLQWLRASIGLAGWETLALADALWMTIVFNAPTSILTGAIFVGLSREVEDRARAGDVARNYLLEAFGSFCGGAAVSLFVLRGGDGVTALLVAGALLWASAAIWAWRRSRRAHAILLGASAAMALSGALFGAGPAISSALEDARWRTILPAGVLRSWVDTPYKRISAQQLPGQTMLAVNGKISASVRDEPRHAQEAAMVLLQRPGARRVVILGPFSPPLARHLLDFGLEELVWLGGDAEATAFARPFYSAEDRAVFRDAELTLVHGDPRAELRELEGPADVVAVLTPEPDAAHSARFYTQRFYREVAAKLAPGGVLVTRLSAAVNYLGGDVASYGAAIYATLGSVFDQVAVSPTERQWFFAADRPSRLVISSATLEGRYRRRPPLGYNLPRGTIAALWTDRRAKKLKERYQELVQREGAALLHRDHRPVATFFALLRHAGAHGPAAAEWLATLRRASIWLLLFPLIIAFAVRGHYALSLREVALARGNSALLTFVGGATAMSLQVTLMLAFQARFGALFGHVGLVTGLFFVGLTAGGWLALGEVRRRQATPSLRFPIFLLGMLALFCAALPQILRASESLDIFSFYALFVLSGALAGAILPAADRMSMVVGAEIGEVAGALDAADHFGGALAGLLMGALMVPLWGVAASMAVIVFALLATLALVGQQAWSLRGRQGELARWLLRRSRYRSFSVAWLPHLAIALALCASAAALVARGRVDLGQRTFSPTELEQRLGPGAYLARSYPFAHYLIDRGKGGAAGAAAASAAAAPEVRGYGGRLNLLVAVDAQRRLRRVRLLASRETPIYISGLARWLEKLEGREVSALGRLRALSETAPRQPDEVDAIAGATISARACLQATRRTARRLLAEGLGQSLPPVAAEEAAWRRWLSPGGIYLLFALLATLLVVRFGGSRWRILVLLCSVVFGGLVFNLHFSLLDVRRIFWLEVPLPEAGALLFYAVIATALLFGPIYCGYLCPLGAVQELLARLGFAAPLSPEADERARALKYVVLFLLAVWAFPSGSEAALAFDPLQYQLGRTASATAGALLVLIALGALVVLRPFCRYLCPVGALLNLFNKLRLGRRWQRVRLYDRCDLGVKGPRHVDCLQCDRCVQGSTSAPRRSAPSAPREDA